MTIKQPTEPAQRTGGLGPVINQPKPAAAKPAIQRGQYVWEGPDGKWETRDYPATQAPYHIYIY